MRVLDSLSQMVPIPDAQAHKYSRGKCVLVAGYPAYPGAACLAAQASQYAGAGYTEVFTAHENKLMIRLFRPSLVVSSFEEYQPFASIKPGHKGAFVVGPGFDSQDQTGMNSHLVLTTLKQATAPVLIDGGALASLPAIKKSQPWFDHFVASQFPLVLTPHGGEAKVLAEPFEINVDALTQEEAAYALSHCYGAVVVLKGPDTVIAYSSRCETITEGTAALAKAGTGDVLAGLIGGFLAQGMDPFDACCLGVYTHARAGVYATQTYGITSVCAEEVLQAIPQALQSIAHP